MSTEVDEAHAGLAAWGWHAWTMLTGREARMAEEIDDLTRALGETHVELRAIKRGGAGSLGFR